MAIHGRKTPIIASIKRLLEKCQEYHQIPGNLAFHFKKLGVPFQKIYFGE